MTGMRIMLVQHPAPAANQADLTHEQVMQLLRENVREATRASRDARINAREAARMAGQRPVIAVPAPPAPGLPGQTVEYGGFDNSHLIPPQAVDIAQGFFIMCAVMVVGWPLARAFGRRIERRGETTAAVSPALTDQLQRIEHTVDSMAIEIERISESQRFMVKLQSSTGSAQGSMLPHERS